MLYCPTDTLPQEKSDRELCCQHSIARSDEKEEDKLKPDRCAGQRVDFQCVGICDSFIKTDLKFSLEEWDHSKFDICICALLMLGKLTMAVLTNVLPCK